MIADECMVVGSPKAWDGDPKYSLIVYGNPAEAREGALRHTESAEDADFILSIEPRAWRRERLGDLPSWLREASQNALNTRIAMTLSLGEPLDSAAA